MPHPGKVLVVVGLVLVAAGVYLLLGGRTDWVGRLPGDVTVKREHFTVHVPVATCLLVSAVLSLILWFLRK